MTARFLKEEDRHKAIARVRENRTGIKSNEVKKSQIVEAFCDVKLWMLFAIQFAFNIPNGGITTVRPYS